MTNQTYQTDKTNKTWGGYRNLKSFQVTTIIYGLSELGALWLLLLPGLMEAETGCGQLE